MPCIFCYQSNSISVRTVLREKSEGVVGALLDVFGDGRQRKDFFVMLLNQWELCEEVRVLRSHRHVVDEVRDEDVQPSDLK